MREIVEAQQPVDLWVGSRVVRWWDEPAKCPHCGRHMCPSCSKLTKREAEAVRDYVDRLRAHKGLGEVSG